jgi:hypothetical protein
MHASRHCFARNDAKRAMARSVRTVGAGFKPALFCCYDCRGDLNIRLEKIRKKMGRKK